jgi:uncharacterized iron-regulated membrane protein
MHTATGLEQGRRGEYEGFVNLQFKFHSTLLPQDIGKAILAWLALSYLALLISGLVLRGRSAGLSSIDRQIAQGPSARLVRPAS